MSAVRVTIRCSTSQESFFKYYLRHYILRHNRNYEAYFPGAGAGPRGVVSTEVRYTPSECACMLFDDGRRWWTNKVPGLGTDDQFPQTPSQVPPHALKHLHTETSRSPQGGSRRDVGTVGTSKRWPTVQGGIALLWPSFQHEATNRASIMDHACRGAVPGGRG